MYIGLDLGTSGLKGILIDDDQKIVAEATAPLTAALGRRVLAVSLEGQQAPHLIAAFDRARTTGILHQILSVKCAARYANQTKKYEHRCLRRQTLILGEGFRPVKNRD